MGAGLERFKYSLEYAKYPDLPRFEAEPKYDPHFGFEDKRTERVMIATQDEMESAKLTPEQQDYCAHLLIKYLGCKREHIPFHKHACHHAHHAYATCELDDYIIRMKDFERERRLAERQRRIDAKEIKED